MPRLRLLVAASLLVVTLGAAGALAYWGATREAPAASGAFAVSIVGPGNASLWSGRVDVANATALSALQAAAAQAGLDVKVRAYPGLGSYVYAIGAFEASGSAGWIYEVDHGSDVVSGDRAADLVALRAGDALVWRWTDG